MFCHFNERTTDRIDITQGEDDKDRVETLESAIATKTIYSRCSFTLRHFQNNVFQFLDVFHQVTKNTAKEPIYI